VGGLTPNHTLSYALARKNEQPVDAASVERDSCRKALGVRK